MMGRDISDVSSEMMSPGRRNLSLTALVSLMTAMFGNDNEVNRSSSCLRRELLIDVKHEDRVTQSKARRLKVQVRYCPTLKSTTRPPPATGVFRCVPESKGSVPFLLAPTESGSDDLLHTYWRLHRSRACVGDSTSPLAVVSLICRRQMCSQGYHVIETPIWWLNKVVGQDWYSTSSS